MIRCPSSSLVFPWRLGVHPFFLACSLAVLAFIPPPPAKAEGFSNEDMEVCVVVQKGKGMNSSSYRPGRLSHLEVPIWHIQRYLARQLREAAAHAGACLR